VVQVSTFLQFVSMAKGLFLNRQEYISCSDCQRTRWYVNVEFDCLMSIETGMSLSTDDYFVRGSEYYFDASKVRLYCL
jgi:hypothetical protein